MPQLRDRYKKEMDEAKEDLDKKKELDRIEKAKIEDLEKKYKSTKKKSEQQQLKVVRNDFKELMDFVKTEDNKYYDAIKIQVLGNKYLFDEVPNIDYDTGKEELKHFVEHLQGAYDYWTKVIEEERRTLAKKIHRKCRRYVSKLHKALVAKSKNATAMPENRFKIALATYERDTNRGCYLQGKYLGQTGQYKGKDKRQIEGYTHFFKINQYQLDQKLEKLKANGQTFVQIFLIFIGFVLVYFIYDVCTCIKEDRAKY